MSRKTDCWGIEVGANAIKAIRLIRKGEKVEVAGYDVLRFSKVLTTPDLNVDEEIQVNLDRFISRHNVRGKTVVVSAPGHMALARFAKLPPVEPKKIPDMVKYEAVQQIPFPIDQVEWDYQVFSHDDSPDVEVGIFAIIRERLRPYLNNFKSVGIPVDGLTLSPLALYNAMAYDMELTPESPGVIFVDVGTSATDVVIVENGALWMRTLPLGGNNFTDALVKAFKLSFQRAEKLKREAATNKYARQIFQAMRPVFTDLVQELQRSVGFYQSLNRDANLTKLVGFGSTFRLPGLQKFLKQQLQMEVIRLDNFARVSVDGKKAADFAERTLNMGTAYGLALQGLELETVSANLLPMQMIRQKLWRSKQPWMAAAAGLVVAATAWSTAELIGEQRAYASDLDNTQARINAVTNKAENLVRDWDGVQKSVDQRQRIENLRRILDYRDIWPKFLHDLSLAVLSANPQSELIGNDYKAMAAIARIDRRRIYISKVSAGYAFSYDAGGGGQAASTKLSYEDIWGAWVQQPAAGPEGDPGMGPDGMGPDGMGPGGPGMNQPQPIQQQQPQAQPAAQPGQAATKPPSFVVTIEGTTPYRQAPPLLAQSIIKWLQSRNERLDKSDRPYKIEIPEDPMKMVLEVKPMSTAAVTGGRRGATPAAGPPRSAMPVQPMPGRNVRPERGGLPGAFGGTPALGASTSGDTGTGTLADLLPVRPLSDESRDGDWQFRIQWTIQLERPEVTRQYAETAREKARENAKKKIKKKKSPARPSAMDNTLPPSAAPKAAAAVLPIRQDPAALLEDRS